MNHCDAYEIISMVNKKVTMETNPAYEEVHVAPQYESIT